MWREFSKAMRARICYRVRDLVFQYKRVLVRKKLMSLPAAERGAPRDRRVNKLILPARTELILQVPVDTGPQVQDGIGERAELMPAVYYTESPVKVDNGCVVTSTLSTTEEEAEIFDPVIKLDELGDSYTSEAAIMGVTEQKKDRGDKHLSRDETVTAELRGKHLNEEKKLLGDVCFEYQDVFYLSGDRVALKQLHTPYS